MAINLVGGSIADIWKGPKGEFPLLALLTFRTKYPNEHLRNDFCGRYRPRSIYRRSHPNESNHTQLALDLLDPTYRLRSASSRLLVPVEGDKR